MSTWPYDLTTLTAGIYKRRFRYPRNPEVTDLLYQVEC